MLAAASLLQLLIDVCIMRWLMYMNLLLSTARAAALRHCSVCGVRLLLYHAAVHTQ